MDEDERSNFVLLVTGMVIFTPFSLRGICFSGCCQTFNSQTMINKSNIVIKNKRALFDYEILDRYVAGIQLFGTEIKSIRDGKSRADRYVLYFYRR